jgi:8-amino-7-oxononanoate synthase
MTGASRVRPHLADAPILSFSSNDYLGLACHPALAAAAAFSAARSGFGAGAARLVSGDHAEHRDLEAGLAHFLGYPAALLFPSGYQANLAALTALAGPQDLIVSDRANHASLLDAWRLSRAKAVFYPHCNATRAADLLAKYGPKARRRFLVTESLFSMDGDVAPLAELADLAAHHQASLVVDEAHALGVLGPDGRGLCQAAQIQPDLLIGTLGKAFGAAGGFIASSAQLRNYLLNRGRTFIFTTAQPPPLAAAAFAALALITGPEGQARRLALLTRIRQLNRGLGLHDRPDSPIFPIILGEDARALAASAALRDQGIFAQPIRPPAVREGTARLRIALSALHTPEDIDALAAALTRLPDAP